MKDLVVIGGGTRGLGYAIKERYREEGYRVHLLQRHPNYKCKNNEYTYEFNLDNKNCLNILHEQIKAITTSFEISTLVGHCLTGGSLRVEFGNAKESDIEKVFLHNCLTPMYATQLISSYAEKIKHVKTRFFITVQQ